MLQTSHICSPIFHCWLLSAQHIPTPSAKFQHISVSDFLLLLSDALLQLSWEVGVALQVSLFLVALALEYLLYPEQIRLTYSSPSLCLLLTVGKSPVCPFMLGIYISIYQSSRSS